MTVEELAARMTEREFVAWQRYGNRKMLWPRRLEFYLAQIAQMLSGKGGKLKDFMFDPEDEEPKTVKAKATKSNAVVQAARNFFGFKPVKPAKAKHG